MIESKREIGNKILSLRSRMTGGSAPADCYGMTARGTLSKDGWGTLVNGLTKRLPLRKGGFSSALSILFIGRPIIKKQENCKNIVKTLDIFKGGGGYNIPVFYNVLL